MKAKIEDLIAARLRGWDQAQANFPSSDPEPVRIEIMREAEREIRRLRHLVDELTEVAKHAAGNDLIFAQAICKQLGIDL